MIYVDSFKQVLNEGTSKGNQQKFYKDGFWVKIDNRYCYEGLAEEFVSLFEDCIYDFPHVQYESTIINYNGDMYNGCMSYNMFSDINISFITCRNLFKQFGVSLDIFTKEEDIYRNIMNVVNKIEYLISINILDYLCKLIMLDCLIINEDRHIMNIGVCKNVVTSQFLIAPCFDNGSSLFCTNWTYRKSKTLEENINFARSVSRPFSKFYDKQLEAVLKLGCNPLKVNKARLDRLLSNYYNNFYSDELNKRVKEVLCNRLSYYNGTAFIFV